MTYVGRFAPSPTGPLHYGSLVAALASYLDARARNGTWLLRVEDLDPPRESADAPAQIIRQLRAFSLQWDGDILYQSSRLDAYADTLAQLEKKHLVYYCTCSRKTAPAVYPGTCREQSRRPTGADSAVRLRLGDTVVSIDDERLGEISWKLSSEVGDYIIRRKDGLFAYQLAVVVDDIYQGVTDVVRGVDLLDSTPRQLALYDLLGQSPPRYLHVPVIIDSEKVKLSKQTRAKPVTTTDPLATLRSALTSLGQDPQVQAQNVAELLARATDNWDTANLPAQDSVLVPEGYR